MRTTILRLALLGAAASMPAYAQISPATPDRDRPPAATEGSTRPGMVVPAPRADSIRPDTPNQHTPSSTLHTHAVTGSKADAR